MISDNKESQESSLETLKKNSVYYDQPYIKYATTPEEIFKRETNTHENLLAYLRENDPNQYSSEWIITPDDDASSTSRKRLRAREVVGNILRLKMEELGVTENMTFHLSWFPNSNSGELIDYGLISAESNTSNGLVSTGLLGTKDAVLRALSRD